MRSEVAGVVTVGDGGTAAWAAGASKNHVMSKPMTAQPPESRTLYATPGAPGTSKRTTCP